MKKKKMLTIVLALMLLIMSLSIFSLTGFGDSPANVSLDETLPVELSSFTASVLANGFVQLQWVSETETNMLGYNVYRGPVNKLTEAVAITRSIIPAHNTSTTTEYIFTDEDVTPGESYCYWLQSVDLDLTNEFHGPISVMVDEEESETPSVYVTSLQKNYPNPFNPNTTIEYSIREETEMSLTIYNIKGEFVRTLYSGVQEAGSYKVNWDGTCINGRYVTSGIYFYRLTTCHFDQINKMLLVK